MKRNGYFNSVSKDGSLRSVNPTSLASCKDFVTTSQQNGFITNLSRSERTEQSQDDTEERVSAQAH